MINFQGNVDAITQRTYIRWAAMYRIAIVLALALLGGTYINARWSGPSTITISPSPESPSVNNHAA